MFFLVGGSVHSTSQGPELLLLLGLSTSPQLEELPTLCVVALCLCQLHFSSLGILLDLFFEYLKKSGCYG